MHHFSSTQPAPLPPRLSSQRLASWASAVPFVLLLSFVSAFPDHQAVRAAEGPPHRSIAQRRGSASAASTAEPRRDTDPIGDFKTGRLVRLSPKYDVWVDPRLKRVVMRGEIVLRDGFLELFACLKGTKEHEAIVAVDTEAKIVHAALLAVGAQPGHPVVFRPQYRPASGTTIDVYVFWTDKRGRRHKARAQDWVVNSETNQPLKHRWVFGGSSFWEDEQTGQRFYQAEDGDLICISNFPSALMDLPVEVSQANDALVFKAWTDRIPPIGTPVTLVLVPEAKPREKAQSRGKTQPRDKTRLRGRSERK